MSEGAIAIHYRFESDAFAPDTFRVVDFVGFEQISTPYEYTINLASTDLEIDLGLLLRDGARLVLAHGDHEEKIHGVLAECHQTGVGERVAYYRVVLVPKLWLLSRQIQNQVHQAQKIDQTLREELEQSGLVQDEDFAIRLTRTDYPEREYIVQYQESDLAFLRRQMEHYGIFFYFEQGEEKEKLIIADANSAFPEIEGDVAVPYRPPEGQVADWGVVQSLVCTHKRMPEKVISSDYNYRTPSVRLRVEHPVSPNGRGIVSYYGDHFKTPEEGAMLAEVRAQELLAQERVFRGNASVLRFHAGRVFTLEEHPRADLSGQSFLIEALRREGEQPLGDATGGEDGEYRSEVTMIPAETVYRPPRGTPKPKVYGVINAKVDAAGSGQYAELDGQGRYKVKLPFDLTERGDGQASRFVRKSEPYAGPGYGQHFPLHRGCEVLLTCIDGDPDRPIIANAAPNAEMASPVNDSNPRVSQIRTGGGILMEMDDSAGGERIKMTVPHSDTYFHLGAPNQGEPGFWVGSSGLMNLFFGNDINTHTDTNRKDTTSGNSEVQVDGKLDQRIQGPVSASFLSTFSQKVIGTLDWFNNGDSFTKTLGTANSVKAGMTNDLWVGAKHGVSIGTSFAESISSNIALKQALDFSHTMGMKGSKDDATDVTKDGTLIQTVDSTWSVTVGSSARHVISGPFYIQAAKVHARSDGDIMMWGDGKVTLKVGGSTVDVTDGKITIKAADVLIDGQLTVTKPAKLDRNATST